MTCRRSTTISPFHKRRDAVTVETWRQSDAVVLTPAVIRRLAHVQGLQHLPNRLPRMEQPVGLPELFDDLLRTVTMTFLF